MLGYFTFKGYTELRIALTVLVVILCCLPIARGSPRRVGQTMWQVGRRRWLAISIVFVVSFVATAGLSLKRGYPLPYVHDELSYMLAADTFAHGRLTNPTPPGWEHFESMHILVKPSYQSKYPPGQGLFMALGQSVFGHPIWGVWISTALACAAACWMLYAFVSPPWALVGGLMMAIHPQMLEWGQRYWGGCVAVLGGCLVVGAVGRISKWRHEVLKWRHEADSPSSRRRFVAPSLLAIGLFILAISRPFEGLVLAVLLLTWLAFALWRMVKREGAEARAPILRHIVIPTIVVLAPAMAWLGYYNYRITGHPLRMPYVEHQSQYGVVPLFLFGSKRPEPVYNCDALRIFHVRDQGYYYSRFGKWREMTAEVVKNTFGLFQTIFGNAESLAFAAFMLPWMFARDRRMRAYLVIMLLFWAALMAETYLLGHYAAPAAGICLLLIIHAMRLMWRSSPMFGRLVVRCMLGIFILFSAFWSIGFFNWKIDGWALRKATIAKELTSAGGQHLVFVQYDIRRPVISWTRIAAEAAWATISRGEPNHFAFSTGKGLPQNPPPIAGESRTIWFTEKDVSLEKYWEYRGLWPDREWWRLELYGDDEKTVAIYRELADHYIRLQPGNHLVFFREEKDKDDDGQHVRPGPCKLRRLIRTHDIHGEWVYNSADIASAPVIWARDMGEAKNAVLLKQYPSRKAWIVNPEVDLAGVRAYPSNRN